MKWIYFYAVETTARLILCDYYHAAFDYNLDGRLDVLDLQLWINAWLTACQIYWI